MDAHVWQHTYSHACRDMFGDDVGGAGVHSQVRYEKKVQISIFSFSILITLRLRHDCTRLPVWRAPQWQQTHSWEPREELKRGKVGVRPTSEHHWPVTWGSEASQGKANRSREPERGSRFRTSSTAQTLRGNTHHTGLQIKYLWEQQSWAANAAPKWQRAETLLFSKWLAEMPRLWSRQLTNPYRRNKLGWKKYWP